jgi:hypothetical protein
LCTRAPLTTSFEDDSSSEETKRWKEGEGVEEGSVTAFRIDTPKVYAEPPTSPVAFAGR